MNTLLLGGAPNGNWVPLLLILIGAFAVFTGTEYLLKRAVKRLHSWWYRHP